MTQYSLCVVLVAFLGFGLDRGTCYPQGPPPSTCTTMFPKHGVEKQSSQPPFGLALSKDTYTPGEAITVTVQSPSNQAFVGFQVTAHRFASSGNAEEFLGTFTPPDNSTQVIACLGQPGKMWAHKDNIEKRTLSATWTAPGSNLGDVQFLLTVVEQKLTFWHKIPATLRAPPGAVVEPDNKVPRVDVPPILVVNWTACGDTKGCWLVPEAGRDSCKGSDCQAALAYEKRGNLFFLEMAVKGQGSYISVGFSEDKMMGDDQTITCTANPGHESIQVGYNPMKYNDRQYTVGLSNLVAGQLNGQTYCRLTRQAAITSIMENGGTKTFDLNDEFFLFLAWGHVYDGTDVIGKHQDAPAISSNKVDLTVFQPTSAAPRTVLSSSLCFVFVIPSLLLKTW